MIGIIDYNAGNITSVERALKHLNIDFSELKKINQDTVGYIKVNNTNIEYIVVKGNNNDLGAKKSKHSSSILKEEERVLDTLKGGRKGLGGHVTNKASSLLLRGVK